MVRPSPAALQAAPGPRACRTPGKVRVPGDSGLRKESARPRFERRRPLCPTPGRASPDGPQGRVPSRARAKIRGRARAPPPRARRKASPSVVTV
jgi:hypothetical protein